MNKFSARKHFCVVMEKLSILHEKFQSFENFAEVFLLLLSGKVTMGCLDEANYHQLKAKFC